MKYLLLLILLLSTSAYAKEIRLATWNTQFLFDEDMSENDPTNEVQINNKAKNKRAYNKRIKKFANAINKMNVDIIALQEIEDIQTMQDLQSAIRSNHRKIYNIAFVQGRDSFTDQDVGYLIRNGIDFEFKRFDFTPLVDIDGYKNLSKHLKLQANIDGQKVTLITVHLLSRNKKGREQQARTLRYWIDSFPKNSNIIVLGDFNSPKPYRLTSPGTEIGIIRGLRTPIIADDLDDTHKTVADGATHINGKQYDRILISHSLLDDDGLQFKELVIRDDLTKKKRSNQKDLSDHFPLVAIFELKE